MSETKDKKSAKFQVRISPDLNEKLETFANAIQESKNTCIELALIHCLELSKTAFTNFVDEFNNGMFLIIKDGLPIANVVRRNVISLDQLPDDSMKITLKIKLPGNIWDKKTINFTKNENRHAIKHFESWGLL